MGKLFIKKTSLVVLMSFLIFIFSDTYPLQGQAELDGVVLIEKGEAEYMDGFYRETLDSFNRALAMVQKNGNRGRLLLDIALVNFALGENEKCSETLSIYVNENPEKKLNRELYPKGFLQVYDQARMLVQGKIAEQKKLEEQKRAEELAKAKEQLRLEQEKIAAEKKETAPVVTKEKAKADKVQTSVQEKEKPVPQIKKKKKFPWLLAILGVGVIVVVAVLLFKKKNNSPCSPTATYANGVLTVSGVRYELASIPAGTFQMGNNSSEASSDEQPVHTVQISKAFWLGKTEVTQGLWQAVMCSNPSYFKSGDNYPVEQVSWDDCQVFITKLNQMVGGNNFRLPTEAEWEYSCRAGTTGDRYGDIDAIAWYSSNSGNTTHIVGQKQANAWGLYDTLGNVWEWNQDFYGYYYYSAGDQTDPTGPETGVNRVIRGGSWYWYNYGAPLPLARSSFRSSGYPVNRLSYIGFRLARTN
jgi:formylglycine-generating enzyme required for sulfatase activity